VVRLLIDANDAIAVELRHAEALGIFHLLK